MQSLWWQVRFDSDKVAVAVAVHADTKKDAIRLAELFVRYEHPGRGLKIVNRSTDVYRYETHDQWHEETPDVIAHFTAEDAVHPQSDVVGSSSDAETKRTE